jgi:hypothetical protein
MALTVLEKKSEMGLGAEVAFGGVVVFGASFFGFGFPCFGGGFFGMGPVILLPYLSYCRPFWREVAE